MAATSSDSDSDSISEEVRLQQKLLEETKNKLNKPEKRITKLVGKLSPVKKAAISSSESSDDEESNTNNKNATLHTKEIFMMQNRLKELKYQAKQLNNDSESDENKSKTPIGKLSSNKTDSDTDDSEKIANAMLSAIKLTQIKSKNSDTDSDSDSDVPTKNIATEQNSTILNSPVKTVPLRTSTPNIANKFIQAASLSTKKNVLHKILANSNNVVKKINQPENSTPTTKKPKSILKNSAQKNKPNPDDSDSDRTTLPLNQEGLKLKNESDDSDSFSRAISSTQIINTNVQTSASDSETVVTPQIQKNDTAQKRLSFSKQLASHKSMASDKFESDNSKSKINSSNKTTRIEENKDASNKSSTQNKPNFSTQQKSEETSSSSSSSDDDSNLASNNKLNSSNNNIATMKTMLEVSAVYSASSEEEPTVTPISNSLNVKTTKPLTTTSKKVPAKKAPPKKAPPKKAPPKKPPTKKTPPKKLISSNNEISSKKITPKVSASLQENLPLRQIEISSSSSSSDEDEVDNMRIVEKIEPIKQVNISKKMPATKAVSKSLCNSKNSDSDFATQKFNTIKNVSMSEKLKIQNNLKTEQELSSDSDSDSEDEHSNNVQKMSNIQNNIPKNIEDMSNSSNEFQNKNSKIFKNSTLTSEQKLTPNSAIQNNSKNAQESSSDSDSDSEEVAKSAKNVKDNTTTSEQKSLTKSTIQMNNSKNAQESTSDSDSDSEKEVAKSAKNFKTNTISEQKSSPKSTIQMNILKIAQESTSDSDSDSEEEGAKSAKNVKTNTTSDQKSTPKSTIQINNSKIAQESSSDSDSDSEKEVSKIAIISKNNTTTSEQKCSPKTTIQINNSKNTLESSSDSDSDSEEEVSKSVKISTSTTLTSNQKLLPKSINQNNNSKNALESSSDSDSDSETETKSTKNSSSREIEMQKTNNLSSQNKGNSFVYQKQLGNTEAQSILKHKNILDDMCSSSSSDNESSSSGGKKKKELPKTKITKCEKETASSVDSQGEEQKKLTTERMKALCDVKVVDTKSILDNQQVSGMYDSLKKYTLTNPNLKRIDAKTSLLLDDLNDDVEIWLTQCPKSLVPDLLIGQKFDFDKKSAFKMKVGSEKYTGVSQRTDKLNLCLIGSESKNNPELSIKIVKPVGTLILHQVMKAKSPIHFEKEEQFKVESPANLKVRHPIFGSNFKDKLKLDDEVEQKLLQAEIVRRKADTKAAKKKQRKSVAKSEKKKAENTNKDEIIFQLLNQTKNVINAPTEVNAKQKNKKRKISEVEPTVQSPNKLAKLDVSEVDSPTKPVAKSKKQSKTVKNVGKVKLSQPLETDSNDLLVENKVDSPTKQVAKKKKKSKTIETVTTKNVTLNKPSETKLDYSQNTLMENIIQSTMKDLEIEQLPIKHRKKKSKKDKHGDENPSIISKDEIISMNNSSPTKSKTAFIINSQSASEELENKDVHKKKKNKKHDKDKLNIVEKLPEIAHKEDENKPNKSFANSIPYMQQIVTKKRSSKAKDNNESINQSSTDANNSASKKKKKDRHKDISVTEDQLDTETKEMNDFSPEKKRKKTKDKLVEDLSINKSMDNSSKTKVKKIKNKNLEIIDKEKVIEELLNSVLKSTKIDKPSKKRKTPKDVIEVLNIENTAEGKHKKRSKN